MVACLVASCETHVSRCCVRVDLARLEGHGATIDVEATSVLPNKEGTPFGQFQIWSSIGAMEEVSGRVQKASTHAGSVGVDLAVVERDYATANRDATSSLPNNKAHQ